jgi:hypothetical protein
MKSAYELAMERLNKASPAVKLTNAQKNQLAELDSKYAAKIAEREIALKDEIAKANESGEFERGSSWNNNSSTSGRSCKPSWRKRRKRCGGKAANDGVRRFNPRCHRSKWYKRHDDQ